MSKVKSSDVPHYELLCLFSNKFSETEVEPIRERISKLITDAEGQITSEEYWGKRKLAYDIDGFRHGYYHLIEFNLEGKKLADITNRLRLASDILRHQVIRKKLKTAAELQAEEEMAKKIATRRKAQETEAKEAAAATEEKADDDRTELKDLDQELDKIIDASNLL
jgi:small subunit ribosomal protein S6